MTDALRWCVSSFEHGGEVPEQLKFNDRLGAMLVAEAKAKSGKYSSVTVFELRSREIFRWMEL